MQNAVCVLASSPFLSAPKVSLAKQRPTLECHFFYLSVQAYARANTFGAAARKLGIGTLFSSGGRSSETSYISWESLQWDEQF